MNDIIEIVDLPDPAVRPLVHPLDVPPARRELLRSWLLTTFASPAVALCIAALIWFTGHAYLPPVLAGVTIIVFGVVAGRWFADRAWDFIPRKRQDRGRALPISWDLVGAIVAAVALFVTLLLVAHRLDQSDVSRPVRDATLGVAVAVALLMIAELVVRLVIGRGAARRRALLSLPAIVAVVGIVVIVHRDVSGVSAATWWGAGGMVVFGVVAVTGKLYSSVVR